MPSIQSMAMPCNPPQTHPHPSILHPDQWISAHWHSSRTPSVHTPDSAHLPHSNHHHPEKCKPVNRPISRRRLIFEHARPSWLRECVAEATGVFCFVFCGISSIASFTLHQEDPRGVAAFGNTLQIGFAFAIGVALAIITCAPVSGGHFNPAITLAMAFWQGFPWKKVPYYIFSQILGAFLAAMLVIAMWWEKVWDVSAALKEAGLPLVGGSTPASMLCPMPHDWQSPGYLFLNEFFADFFIGLAIWAALDPTNPFVRPVAIPFVIGLAYAVMIWGFGGLTLSTNFARDLGPRMVAAIFFGKEAFTHKGYAPIGMLVNIPATLLATAYYELWMRDSLLTLRRGQATFDNGDEAV